MQLVEYNGKWGAFHTGRLAPGRLYNRVVMTRLRAPVFYSTPSSISIRIPSDTCCIPWSSSLPPIFHRTPFEQRCHPMTRRRFYLFNLKVWTKSNQHWFSLFKQHESLPTLFMRYVYVFSLAISFVKVFHPQVTCDQMWFHFPCSRTTISTLYYPCCN